MENPKSLPSLEDSVLIIGCGVFGVGFAIELKKRGYKNVRIVDETVREGKDKGTPNPIASSTDISKVVRSDYGNDEVYTFMNDEAIDRWHALNKKWGEEIYHECGLLVLSTHKQLPPVQEDTFQLLKRVGYPIQKIDGKQIKDNYPKFTGFQSAYLNKRAGWAESGRALGKFIEDAEALNVDFTKGHVKQLIWTNENGKRKVEGAVLDNGKEVKAKWVIVAAGCWTPFLVPHLKDVMVPSAQPVFHFKPTKYLERICSSTISSVLCRPNKCWILWISSSSEGKCS